jgi:hypothetical protein
MSVDFVYPSTAHDSALYNGTSVDQNPVDYSSVLASSVAVVSPHTECSTPKYQSIYTPFTGSITSSLVGNAGTTVSLENLETVMGQLTGNMQPHSSGKCTAAQLEAKTCKYEPPTQETQTNVAALINALNAFDNQPSAANLQQVTKLLANLNMHVLKLADAPDLLIIYPDATKTPITCATTITWNLGKVQKPGDSSTANNPLLPLILIEPHPGQDGTTAIMYRFLNQANNVLSQVPTGQTLAQNPQLLDLLKVKATISHYFNPNIYWNAAYNNKYPISPTNLHRPSDPAHSGETILTAVIGAVHKLFPYAVGLVVHGEGTPTHNFWGCNDRNANFRNANGAASFDALLTINLAISDPALPTPSTKDGNRWNVLSSGTTAGVIVPGTMPAAAGGTQPLIGADYSQTIPLVALSAVYDNTDATGHEAQGVGPFDLVPENDPIRNNWLVIEFSPTFRTGNSAGAKVFADALIATANQFVNYNPAIHDPWELASRFPLVHQNMTLYPKLFDPTFVQEYLAKGTNPYSGTISTKSVTISSVVSNISATLTQPVLFSSTANQIATAKVAEALPGEQSEQQDVASNTAPTLKI